MCCTHLRLYICRYLDCPLPPCCEKEQWNSVLTECLTHTKPLQGELKRLDGRSSSDHPYLPNRRPQQKQNNQTPRNKNKKLSASSQAYLDHTKRPPRMLFEGKGLPRVPSLCAWYTSRYMRVILRRLHAVFWVGSRVRRPSRSPPMPPLFLYSAHPGDRRQSRSTPGWLLPLLFRAKTGTW